MGMKRYGLKHKDYGILKIETEAIKDINCVLYVEHKLNNYSDKPAWMVDSIEKAEYVKNHRWASWGNYDKPCHSFKSEDLIIIKFAITVEEVEAE